MPAARQPRPASTGQAAANKFFRGLAFYAALLACVIIAMAVSFSVILHFGRESLRDHATDPEALVEARSLRDFARELTDIAAVAEAQMDDGQVPSDSFSRRLNDLRRRMRRFPHESIALNALMLAGDRMLAWTSAPGDVAAKRRATDALAEAQAAVKSRLATLSTT